MKYLSWVSVSSELYLNFDQNILGCRILIAASAAYHLLDKLRIDLASAYTLHHRQMFEVVMRLEQGVSREKFHQDAANTPNVTRETPTQIQDNLRSPVVTRRDDGGMILIVKGGRTEIDQSNLTVKKNAALTRVPARCVGRRRDGAVVGERLIGIVHQKNVLRLQISVDEVEIV